MCEHIPRLMQVAPHANPISLLHCLVEQAKNASNKSTNTKFNSSSRTAKMWSMALNYARKEAKKKFKDNNKNEINLFYNWPKVGEIIKVMGMKTKDESKDTENTEEVVNRKDSTHTFLANMDGSLFDESSDNEYVKYEEIDCSYSSDEEISSI